MLSVKIGRSPRELNKRRNIYKANAEKQNLWYKRHSKNNKESKANLYKYYKNNKIDLNINYSCTPVKNALLKLSSNRCCICGRYIEDANQSINTNYDCTSVEHIVPETDDPKSILSWKNLLPSCTRCNSIRGSKHPAGGQEKYRNPRKIFNIHNHFRYNFDGTIEGKTKEFQDMVDLYQLNKQSSIEYNLVNDRKAFYMQLANPYFKKMLKLERIKKRDIGKFNGIVFYDMYLNYRHYKFIRSIKHLFNGRRYKKYE